MKRRWNAPVWVGFAIILSALPAYLLVFARFPVTRDLPWATFLMFGLGFALMGLGLRRAWREPHLHRGKVGGMILASLGVVLFGLFVSNVFYFARQLPAAAGTPLVGAPAPDFTLPDQEGRPVTLTQLLRPGPAGGEGTGGEGRANGVVLVFYRGFW